MFSNIGKKIKTLTKVITVIEICIYLIAGIIVGVTVNAGIGLAIFVLGAVSAWVGSFILYGFGQLIESAQNIEKRICPLDLSNENRGDELQVPSPVFDPDNFNVRQLTTEQKDHIRQYIQKNETYHAAKELSKITGLSLNEAIDIIGKNKTEFV